MAETAFESLSVRDRREALNAAQQASGRRAFLLEKDVATAMHVFCRQQRQRGDRLSRHWHDVVRLDETEYAGKALADRSLALSVARHKAAFFREKDASGRWIDYIRDEEGYVESRSERTVQILGPRRGRRSTDFFLDA